MSCTDMNDLLSEKSFYARVLKSKRKFSKQHVCVFVFLFHVYDELLVCLCGFLLDL